MASGDAVYAIRVARPADTEAVGMLLSASYSNLLTGHYDGDTLRRALPYLTRANLKLLASSTYYVATREDGDLVGCGGWTTAPPGSCAIVERGSASATLRRLPRVDAARDRSGPAAALCE
jgi:hypothetical protein